MSAIARTGERFGITHVVSVVIGEDSDRIRQLGHDKIKTFGVGSDKDRRHWRLLIDNLLAQELIIQTQGDYPVIQLQPSAREVLFEGRQVHILKTEKVARKRRRKGSSHSARISAELGGYDENLFEQLRALRKELATEQHVPPFVIFSDKTLHEMARHLPTTDDQMLDISGIGDTKLERYGKQFAEIIKDFTNKT
jgi:ATP-dependent DNA helicase RecQ